MNQLTTTGIILQRTDYGEADRILVLLTPDKGKLHVLAKGVRRVKSKLAGGIELFSISHLTYIQGRSSLGTLVSARLVTHYGDIVKDVNRTMMGYELIKQLHKATEDEPEEDYFHLLQQGFEALNDPSIELPLIQLWFSMQLLRISGHTPNLRSDTTGAPLVADKQYIFSFDDMSFAPANPGQGRVGVASVDQIKFLRLGFSGYPPKVLQQVQSSASLVKAVAPLVQAMAQTYIRS